MKIINPESFEAFYIGVPHQKPPFIVRACDLDALPPVDEDDDEIFEGDHDLSGVYNVDSIEEAQKLLATSTHGGVQARHQAIKIAVLVERELVDMGVAEDDE